MMGALLATDAMAPNVDQWLPRYGRFDEMSRAYVREQERAVEDSSRRVC